MAGHSTRLQSGHRIYLRQSEAQVKRITVGHRIYRHKTNFPINGITLLVRRQSCPEMSVPSLPQWPQFKLNFQLFCTSRCVYLFDYYYLLARPMGMLPNWKCPMTLGRHKAISISLIRKSLHCTIVTAISELNYKF